MIFSPLEQFVIYSFINISNTVLVCFIIGVLFYSLKLSELRNVLASHIEWWYTDMKHVPGHIFILLTVWLFILSANVLGMLPYFSTITAQFILVLSITIPLFIGINILGLLIHGFNLFYLMLPSGVPLALTPIIAFLEFFSYFIRVLSLTLRLSANLIAGHILIKIILSVFMSFPLFSIFILPMLILEIIVAFLQAYVYIVLILSYYQDVFLPH